MDELADDDEFSFRLIPSPEEKNKQTLEGVSDLIQTLTDAGVYHVPPRIAYDAVDGGGISVHEFTLLITALAALSTPPASVLVAWLKAKSGRGIKVKGVDGAIEAPTAADAEALMRVQHELAAAAKKGKRKRIKQS